MSSRSEILGAIQALEKREIFHPGDFKSYKVTQDLVGDFKNSLSIVGAICIEAENMQKAGIRLSEIYPLLMFIT